MDFGCGGGGRVDASARARACLRHVGRPRLHHWQRASPARHTVQGIGPVRPSCLPVERIVALTACQYAEARPTALSSCAAGAARGLGRRAPKNRPPLFPEPVKMASLPFPPVRRVWCACSAYVWCAGVRGEGYAGRERGGSRRRAEQRLLAWQGRTVDVCIRAFRTVDGIVAIVAYTWKQTVGPRGGPQAAGRARQVCGPRRWIADPHP